MILCHYYGILAAGAEMCALETCSFGKRARFMVSSPVTMVCHLHVILAAGAETCALETCSFSKYAGFTGTRLGWTVIPDALKFADGSKVQVRVWRLLCCSWQTGLNAGKGRN
jgi:hypothetical protein